MLGSRKRVHIDRIKNEMESNSTDNQWIELYDSYVPDDLEFDKNKSGETTKCHKD